MRQHLLIGFGWIILATASAAAQDKLPEGAAFRIGTHRLRVTGSISDFAFTPDHRTLVVAYEEHDKKKPNVVLFDVATGLERSRLAVRGVQHLDMARDKPWMVVDSNDGVEL